MFGLKLNKKKATKSNNKDELEKYVYIGMFNEILKDRLYFEIK